METSPLDQIQNLVNEIDSDVRRMKRDRKPDVEQVHAELYETVLPFLRELAMATAQELAAVREYLHEEVEPALQEALGEVSTLTPEDGDLILARLQAYKAILAQMRESAIASAATPDRVSEIDAEIQQTDDAITVVTDATVEEEPAPDGAAPDGQEEEDDEEPEEEVPTRQ